jgi:FKBP-type peptidyl-prolyl cis-trans isomerase
MRMILSIGIGVFLLFGQALAAEQQEAKKEAQSQKEKVSYSLGYDIGNKMKKSSVDLDPEIFVKAIRDGLTGNKATMTDQEMREALGQIQTDMKAKQAEKTVEKKKQEAEKNMEEGEAFLAQNAKKDGVVTLPSGLQYKILKQGTGKSPQFTDKVKVHYRGTLINGAEISSTYKRGNPAVFNVNHRIIKGWREALQLMKEGSKWQLFIPANLAYGERGLVRKGKGMAVIPPQATLIFDMELIEVMAAPSPAGVSPQPPKGS